MYENDCNIDAHCAVVTNLNNEIYLLDVAFSKPINLTRNPEFVKEWIDDILWMNIVEFEEVDIDQK